jgi:hypothetical protein
MRKSSINGGRANRSKDFVSWAKISQATMHRVKHKYQEALTLVDEVGVAVEGNAKGLTDYTRHEYWAIRCKIIKELGTYEDIKEAYRKKLEEDYNVSGPTHYWISQSLVDLDNEFRLQNDFEASAKLQSEIDFESSWAVVCKREDEVKINA